MPSREQILEMLRQEPDDAFLLYSLAMEESKGGHVEVACEVFDRILMLDPDHVASYHQKGQVLMQAGQAEEAFRVLQLGVERAHALGNEHAAAEMQGLIDLL